MKVVMQVVAHDVTILVAEEDEATRTFLADNLCADGYDVEAAKTVAHAHALLRRNPQLLVVDVNGKTLELLEQIRASQIEGADPNIPIIVLSSRVEQLHRLRVFDRGSDDFMSKPFSYPELRARIEAVMRRANGRPRTVTQIGALIVDMGSRVVTIHGDSIDDLSNKEFSLLCALAAEPTRVFTKEELLRSVWGYQSMGHSRTTRTLDSHACRLRKKLGVHGDRFISNVWGVGYRLVDSIAQAA